jgi:Domain of unknown function (DUF4381)
MRGRFPVVRTTLAAGAVAAFLGTGPCAAAAPVDTAVPQAEDIRDIRGPKLIMAEWVLPAALAAGLLLVGGGYALWRRRRRLDARVLLPYEIALQRLEAIRALMQPAKAPEFTTAVSGVVRGYIEQRFKVTATRRTTEEFLRDLFESSNVSLARYQALLGVFLNQCDLVKFAAMSLTLPDMEILHQSARAFVLATAEPEQVIAATSPQSRQSSNNEVGA